MPADVLQREKDIYMVQAQESGRPQKVWDKIVEGKIQKFLNESCLLKQAFVKDPDKTVEDLLNEMRAKTGENVQIRRFARFALGEKL
jgi:elongation factor Ts